ncbi:solute carrier family 23 protein [Streptomyces lavendulae]|uniref:solute carrier family 23 protein n=1 Tax=Streptomyces lavendulae TaxID=1914 RepID=UPI00099D936D
MRARIGQGVATALGSIFGAFMTTTYAENVGLVAPSRIRSRYAVTCCGTILMLRGFVPVLASLVAPVPCRPGRRGSGLLRTHAGPLPGWSGGS